MVNSSSITSEGVFKLNFGGVASALKKGNSSGGGSDYYTYITNNGSQYVESSYSSGLKCASTMNLYKWTKS